MDKKNEEEYLLEQQTLLVKQIKNTYADVKEIKFDKESIDEKKLAGFTTITVDIITKTEHKSIGVDFPVKKDVQTLRSTLGKGPKKGRTICKVKVIYTNGKEEKF